MDSFNASILDMLDDSDTQGETPTVETCLTFMDNMDDSLKRFQLDGKSVNVIEYVNCNRQSRLSEYNEDVLIDLICSNLNIPYDQASEFVHEYQHATNLDPFSEHPVELKIPASCQSEPEHPQSKLSARKVSNGELLSRVCPKCGVNKPSTAFSNTSWRRADGQCKECIDKRVSSTNNHQKSNPRRRSPHYKKHGASNHARKNVHRERISAM